MTADPGACPFCWSADVEMRSVRADSHFAECCDCHAFGPGGSTVAEAAERWGAAWSNHPPAGGGHCRFSTQDT